MLRHALPALARTIGAIALPLVVTACGTTDRIKPVSVVPMEDYRQRHPIVLAEARTSLDVFPSTAGGALDRHTAKQIYALAQQYRELGHGPVMVLVPRGRIGGDQRVIIADVRRLFALAGVHTGIDVSSYPIGDPGMASPVRVSFAGIKARVADQCGQWPNDLASGSSVEGWDNKPYWNLGCATQSMIAAQASDPRDLVTPRGEEATDTQIRARAIDQIRKGADPNTAWGVKNSNIGQVGGN